MTLSRILLRLHSAVLPLLLLAVVAAGAELRPFVGTPVTTVEAAIKASAAHPRAGSVPREIIAATTDLDVDDETELRGVPTVQLAPAERPAIVAKISCAHSAPATHRACAAPPTGPPHA